jgi:ABC-type Mn2+/Zn2+ transport system permease subunit
VVRRAVLGCLLVVAAISIAWLNAVAGLVFVLSVLICPGAVAVLLNRMRLRDDWMGDVGPHPS